MELVICLRSVWHRSHGFTGSVVADRKPAVVARRPVARRRGRAARWLAVVAAVGAVGVLFLLQHYTAWFSFPATVRPGQVLFDVDCAAAGEGQEFPGVKFSGSGEHGRDASLPGGGDASCRLQIQWHAEHAPYRAELVPIAVTGFYQGCYPRLGQEYEYSFRLFLSSDWQIDDDTESVVQWHGAPDRLLFEGDANPPMALNLVGARYELDIRSDSHLVTRKEAGYETSRTIAVGDLRQDIGRWVEWRFRVRWSYRAEEPGRVQVFRDGVCLVDDVGPNCFRDLRGGPYWKVGLYKWSWSHPRDVAPAVRERRLWLEALRIRVPEAADEVAPPPLAPLAQGLSASEREA